jgi:hypothetical protein
MTGTVDGDALILANRTRRTARTDVAGKALADDLAAGYDNRPGRGAAPDTDDDPGAVENFSKSEFRSLIFAGDDAAGSIGTNRANDATGLAGLAALVKRILFGALDRAALNQRPRLS